MKFSKINYEITKDDDRKTLAWEKCGGFAREVGELDKLKRPVESWYGDSLASTCLFCSTYFNNFQLKDGLIIDGFSKRIAPGSWVLLAEAF